MFKYIFFCFFIPIVLIAQSNDQSSQCDCKMYNSKLKAMIEKGNIDALFLSDANNGSYQNWSTSMLCPSGKAPEVLPVNEDEFGESQSAYDEWSCKYSAFCASDNDTSTAWCEGVEGDGIGEFVIAQLDITSEIKIWGGYGKSPALFKANNRPKAIRIYYLGTSDFPEATQFGVGFSNIYLIEKKEYILQDVNDYQIISGIDIDSFNGNFTAGFIAVEILSVYEGDKYKDTCFTEIVN